MFNRKNNVNSASADWSWNGLSIADGNQSDQSLQVLGNKAQRYVKSGCACDLPRKFFPTQ